MTNGSWAAWDQAAELPDDDRPDVGPSPESDRRPWRNLDGDLVQYHAEDAEYYAERVDRYLTVYRAQDDGRIVGVELGGASTWIEAG